MAARMVVARSAAEMPVVTSRLASMDTVNAVPKFDVFSVTISGICSSSRRSTVSGRQMSPRPCMAMKLTASGVTRSAARVRSPSFSRSSSSMTMTIRPARMSSMASSMRSSVTG
jgi:hypothetical protein